MSYLVAALILTRDPAAAPSAVAAEILARATQGRLTNTGSGSPNLLLHSQSGQPARGKPRVQYGREYWVVDNRATPAELLSIVNLAYPSRITVGFSYDDAGIGDLDVRKVVVWGQEFSQQTLRDWYARYYPGVSLSFQPLPRAEPRLAYVE